MWACKTWIYHYKIICDNVRVRKYAKFGVFYAKIVQMTFPEVMDHHNYFVYPSR